MILRILTRIFPLAILPESGLSHSAFPTVFIGLILMTFFTESLGWVYTGLIVPGYLAPILVSQPWAGAVIIFEAIITYLLVRLISDYASKLGIWSNFFGRDRFFAFLIVSVIVRITFEWWVFPTVGSFAAHRFGIQFDYRNYLYSIGLVIVPLLANMFWKAGFFRGSLPVFSVIGLTYLATRYILLPGTNFSVARFELLYEDIAIDFLASPKPYIIFIVGAFLASRANLMYGWDYGGIVVPALLALAWFTPIKVILTVVEAIIIVVIGRFIVSRKFLEAKTIEGPRKTLLVFALSFALKFIVGHISSHYYPGFKATDMYGFGYLLPSLIALKIWQKNIGLAVVPTLRSSMAAVLIGSVIGFSLTFMPVMGISKSPELAERGFIEESGELYNTLRLDKAKILPRRAINSFDKPRPDEMALFKKVVELINDHIESNDKADLTQAASLLGNVNYQLIKYHDTLSDKKYIYLRESATLPGELYGWGLYLFNLSPSNDLVFEVPNPRSEWKTLEVGEILFEHFDAKALLVAGAHYKTNNDGSSDVLKYRRSIYNTVHKYLRTDHIVQVRGMNVDKTTLRIKKDFTLDLNKLEDIIGKEYSLDWGKSSYKDLQRRSSPRSFVSLELSRESRRRAIGRRLFAKIQPVAEERKISGYLMDWFARQKDTIAGKNSHRYRPPTFDEMLYMDEEIIKPILDYQASFSSDASHDGLSLLASTAAMLGYELVDYTCVLTGERYLVLREEPSEKARDSQNKNYWGTYVFKLGDYRPITIEVPHPLSEVNTFEMGCELFEYLNAQSLLIAGAHKDANADREADVIAPQNVQNVFHLVHQVVLRENSPKLPYLVAQVRGFVDYSPSLHGIEKEEKQNWAVNSDIVFSLSKEIAYSPDVPESVGGLEKTLRALGYSVEYFDGAKEHIRFTSRDNLQYQFTDANNMGTFLHIWVNRDVRNLYRSYADSDSAAALLEKMGIPTQKGDLSRWILSSLKMQTLSSDRKADSDEFTEIIELAQQYSRLRNVAYLLHIRQLALSIGSRLLHFVDQTANQEYVIVHSVRSEQQQRKQPIVVINMNSKEGQVLELSYAELDSAKIQDFVRKRLPALVISSR